MNKKQDGRGKWSQGMDKEELSAYMQNLALLKHAQTTDEEKSAHGKKMVDARELKRLSDRAGK